jgi:hypothetical protein
VEREKGIVVQAEPAVAPDRGGITVFLDLNVSPAATAGERCRSAPRGDVGMAKGDQVQQ